MKTVVRSCVAALCACAVFGCRGVPKVGPEQAPVGSTEELARRVSERVAGVTSFAERGARAKVNMYPARADIIIHAEKGLNLKFKNPFTGGDAAKFILNEVEGDDDEGMFVAIHYGKGKALTGETAAVLAKYLPQIGLQADDIHPLKLFFPTFEVKKGERSAFIVDDQKYIAEFWDPQTGPRLQMVVDAWSLVPLAATLYNDGAVLAEFEWFDLTELSEDKLVIARTVKIHYPSEGYTARITSHKPKINARIADAAFRLRIPPGVEEEEVDVDQGS